MHSELRTRRTPGARRCGGAQSGSGGRDADPLLPRGQARGRGRTERFGCAGSGRSGGPTMNVLAIGMSHRTAGVRELERTAVSVADTGKVLDELLHCPQVSEALLLSTCNRVEIYAIVETFHGGLSDLTGVLARHAGVEPGDLTRGIHVHYSAGAVEHLFAVAAGLDSMVVGDAQILGQLRSAYATADKAGTVGRALHELVQHALRVGKRVHAETDIDHVAASVVGVAVADADEVLGGLAGRQALVVGAGSMGALATAALRRAGIGAVVIANRTPVNGARLVRALSEEGIPARSVGLTGLAEHIAAADVVVTCTGATDVVVPTDLVVAGIAGRTHPLVVCDLGLPRDVQAGVAELPGVTLVDLDSLGQRLADTPAGRHGGRDPGRGGQRLPGRAAVRRGDPDGDRVAPPGRRGRGRGTAAPGF